MPVGSQPPVIKAPLFEITEGWTALLGPFTLRVDGVPIDLTGLTITLVMRRQSGTAVTPGGTIDILNQTTNKGQLTYTPVAADFVWESNLYTNAQTYQLHWKAVDGANKVAYFPSGYPSEIIVHRA